jgi:predicted enzyme related to lactoylglutathione lyase
MPGYNDIGWFEIGTDDPVAAERFYAEVFGWKVSTDDNLSIGTVYRFITTGDGDGVRGGLFATNGEVPNYAVFTVLVDDVEAACGRVEKAGGQVLRAPQTNPVGVVFAHLLDPTGNHFEVFKPPSRADLSST